MTYSSVIDLRKDSCDTGTNSSVTNDADITTTANITNDVWITHGNHTLKFSDNRAIVQDEEMTDR